MKKVHILIQGLLLAFMCLGIGACSNDNEPEMNQEKSETHTIPMEFIGNVVNYDSQTGPSHVPSRAATSSWSNGDKIYLTFYSGTNKISGEATYSSSGWSVSFDGNLATGSSLKCEARYFVNATFQSSSLVSLNANSEIYEDLNGKYTYSNGSLTVQATLSPKTGRLRFKGASGTKIYLTGISAYTTFSPGTNAFSSSNAMITATVASSGYTPYIYGAFASSDRNIGLIGSNFAFTRTCTSEVLKAGASGYMAIPSESSHNNWRSGLFVKASGVEFKMIPVAGLSSGFFLIGETEVTTALYNSVNGSSSTSQLPISSIYYSDIVNWIEKLNSQTMLNFSVPSAAQWKYAAKGGNKSQNYTYSGSNTPGDVAWYSGNCSSKQNVKTKAPNELGIYDMSGNVGEFVSDMSGSYNYVYGGCYKSASTYITSTSGVSSYYNSWGPAGYSYSYSSFDVGAGFRLILTCP